MIALIVLCLLGFSTQAQTQTEGCNEQDVVCFLNSGQQDQNEKNIICYTGRDETITEWWSIANEVNISFMFGENEFGYAKSNQFTIVSNEMTMELPIPATSSILGGTTTNDTDESTALLLKTSDNKGVIQVIEVVGEGEVVAGAKTPGGSEILDPVWLFGYATGDARTLIVASATQGIYKVLPNYSFENIISYEEIAGLIGRSDFTISVAAVGDVKAGTNLREIHFAVHIAEQSEVLQLLYDTNTGEKYLKQVLTEIPFLIGGFLGQDDNLILSDTNHGGAYVITDAAELLLKTPHKWSDDIVTNSAKFYPLDLDRPTLIAAASLCAGAVVKPLCVQSTCDENQQNCTYEEAGVGESLVLTETCDNACGTGNIVCSIADDQQTAVTECSVLAEADENDNGEIDCLEPPADPVEPETEIVPPPPVDVVPAVVAAETDDPEDTPPETALSLNSGGFTVGGGFMELVSCSLNTTNNMTSLHHGYTFTVAIGLLSLLALRRQKQNSLMR